MSGVNGHAHAHGAAIIGDGGNLLSKLGVDQALESFRATIRLLLQTPSPTTPELVNALIANLKGAHILGRIELLRRGVATEIPCPTCGHSIEHRSVGSTFFWICRHRTCPWVGVEQRLNGILPGPAGM